MESPDCRLVFCNENDARRIAVKPVYQRDIIALLDCTAGQKIRGRQVNERIVTQVPCPGMNDEAGRFIAGKKVTIFVKDGKIAFEKFRADKRRKVLPFVVIGDRELGNVGVDFNQVSLLQPVILPDLPSGNANAALADKRINPGKRYEREPLPDNPVKPAAGFIFACKKFDH
jgi:hypothetical protein